MALPQRDTPPAMVDGEVLKYLCTVRDLSPLRTGFTPKKFQSLNVFLLCFLKAFLKIRMQKKGFLKMIFLELRNRSAPLFLNPMENKKMVSPFFPLPSFFFFSSPSVVIFPILIWSPLPLFKILKSTRYQSVRFCLHPTARLEQWTENQDKKSCSSGHAGLASCGRRLSTVPKTHVSPFSFILSFSFGTTKAGLSSI